jgi:hypothetical protein
MSCTFRDPLLGRALHLTALNLLLACAIDKRSPGVALDMDSGPPGASQQASGTAEDATLSPGGGGSSSGPRTACTEGDCAAPAPTTPDLPGRGTKTASATARIGRARAPPKRQPPSRPISSRASSALASGRALRTAAKPTTCSASRSEIERRRSRVSKQQRELHVHQNWTDSRGANRCRPRRPPRPASTRMPPCQCRAMGVFRVGPGAHAATRSRPFTIKQGWPGGPSSQRMRSAGPTARMRPPCTPNR